VFQAGLHQTALGNAGEWHRKLGQLGECAPRAAVLGYVGKQASVGVMMSFIIGYRCNGQQFQDTTRGFTPVPDFAAPYAFPR